MDYTVDASSSMDAARQALAMHRHAVADDCVITVIVNGRSPLLHDWVEHNAIQPKFRHKAAAVRKSQAGMR